MRPGAVVDARIVYWGVEGAGKSANLEFIHRKLRPDHRGELQHIPTAVDPGVTYEVLPIELGEISGVRTRLQILAPPGSADQAPTRKQLLDAVDGVVFVIDSRRERLSENLAALEELRETLAAYGRTLDEVPVVLQYNKRDLSDDRAVEELHRKIGLRAAAFEAIAPRGAGILQSLTTISKRVVRNRREAAGLTLPPAEPPPPPPAVPAPVAEAHAPEPAPAPPPDRFGLEPTTPSLEPDEQTVPEEHTQPETAAPTDSVAQAIDAAARRAERVLEAGWDEATGGAERRTQAPPPLGLRVLAAGRAHVEGGARVRLPLRVVDEDGRQAVLTVTLDLTHPRG